MDNLLVAQQPRERYIPKNDKPEEALHRQAVQYLRMVAPTAIYRSDFASGMPMTPNQARRHAALQSSRAFPDIQILEPRKVTMEDGEKRFFYGALIELKKAGTSLVVTRGERKGHLVSDPHIQEQYLMLKELSKRGYYTNFAVGLDEFVKIINWYFGIASNHKLF